MAGGRWAAAGVVAASLSLLLAGGVGPARAGGSVLTVQSSAGGKGGACPGADCTLTGAWDTVGVNGTISLAVSATIDDTLMLYSNAGWRKIVAASPGLTLSPSSTFLNSSVPITTVSRHRLTLEGFTISGFTCSDCGTAGRGGLIYINALDSEGGKTDGKLIQPGSPFAKAQPERKVVASDGAFPPAPTGVVLELKRMEIAGNVQEAVETSTGLIASDCGFNCSIVMTETTFSNNLIVNTNSFFFGDFIFMALLADSDLVLSLYLQGVDFVSNIIKGPAHDPPLASILVYGNVYAEALQFSGNQMGHGPGAISTGANENLYGNVFMEYSTIASNVVTNGKEDGFLIDSSHVHLKEVSLGLPESYTNFVNSTDDMYLSSCSVLANSGNGVLAGFQVFNQNPVSANLVGGATFANCTQAAPWLPCPSAVPVCRNLKNANSQLVGYTCTRN